MSPATHAVLGAAIAGATRRSWLGLWLAVPLAFLSHFLCDAIYHFEAFIPTLAHSRHDTLPGRRTDICGHRLGCHAGPVVFRPV